MRVGGSVSVEETMMMAMMKTVPYAQGEPKLYLNTVSRLSSRHDAC